MAKCKVNCRGNAKDLQGNYKAKYKGNVKFVFENTKIKVFANKRIKLMFNLKPSCYTLWALRLYVINLVIKPSWVLAECAETLLCCFWKLPLIFSFFHVIIIIGAHKFNICWSNKVLHKDVLLRNLVFIIIKAFYWTICILHCKQTTSMINTSIGLPEMIK